MTHKKLRVVHVLYSGSVGGMQRAVYQLVKHMKQRNDLYVSVAFAVKEGPFVEKIQSEGVL